MGAENCLDEVGHLLNKTLHPADRMAALDSALPPEVREGVLFLDDLNGTETGRQAIGDLDFVETRDIVANRALRPVDLDCRGVAMTASDAGGLDDANRSAFELQDRDKRIVDFDLLAGDLRYHRPTDCRDLADFTNKKTCQVDVMSAKITKRASSGDLLVQSPAEIQPWLQVVRHQIFRAEVGHLADGTRLD